MGCSVFIHRWDSIYDDDPAVQYQFPKVYLKRVQTSVQDWIVYYEPTKIPGTRGYFGIARVQEIIPDPGVEDMYLAIIEPGSYLEFGSPVPYKDGDGWMERGVLNPAGRPSGRAQAAVRPLNNEDFQRIVSRGLSEGAQPLARTDAGVSPDPLRSDMGLFDDHAQYGDGFSRTRLKTLISRPVRDRNFRQAVLRAYDQRCAVSGLKLINGGGRAEVEAAHIRPVEHNGPDSIRNGLALSGTVHWMFDRGLISLSDELEVLVSRQANDPDAIHGLINPTGRAQAPPDRRDRPHPGFLKWHREACFKQ